MQHLARRGAHGQGSRTADQGRRAVRSAAREGASKEKAARIANTGRQTAARRGGKSPPYEEWTKDELSKRAGALGIEGRSRMSKGKLIDAIRHHRDGTTPSRGGRLPRRLRRRWRDARSRRRSPIGAAATSSSGRSPRST